MLQNSDKKAWLIEHFAYEDDMLNFSFNKIFECLKQQEQKSLQMALECFLLHARNLLEFFYYRKNGKSYIRAIDFIESKQWEKLLPKKTARIIKLQKRIDNELMHLTDKRISGIPPEKSWDIDILLDFIVLTKIFKKNLPNEYKFN
ncbi:MAG: hypothetical protein WCV50_03475 [Patescibacteria group bacterium]|jgi:hypothetical protein